jgi:hypothetical protein
VIVAFIPAHYPERFLWLKEAMASAQSADRVLIISSYPQPLEAARWGKVEWCYRPELTTTGSKYREAVALTGSDDIIGVLDDDDLWLPEKVAAVRRMFVENPYLQYFAHAAATVREGVPTGLIPPESANGTMTVVRRSLLTSPNVKPFFDRLNWGCDPFLRYAPLAASAGCYRSNKVLAHVRYHEGNSSHPPTTDYKAFSEWQKTTARRFLSAWKLIDDMTRHVVNRPAEVQEKMDEFARLERMSPLTRRLAYWTAQA